MCEVEVEGEVEQTHQHDERQFEDYDDAGDLGQPHRDGDVVLGSKLPLQSHPLYHNYYRLYQSVSHQSSAMCRRALK